MIFAYLDAAGLRDAPWIRRCFQSEVREAGAAGYGSRSALELGHHKAVGTGEWTYFYLYVILDVFSRYVVGWMVADGESAELARRLIGDTCEKQKIHPG